MASEKLSLVCVSGTREKLQMAAMMASVAAAGGAEVAVFFSMNALPYFLKDGNAQPPAEGGFGERMADKNVPPFRQLFGQAKELGGAKLFPCSMAMDMLEVEETALHEMLEAPLGLTRFLSDAAGGQLVVV